MQAKINTFFKPESPNPPSIRDDCIHTEILKSPPIRLTYQRKTPKSDKRITWLKTEINEGLLLENSEAPISADLEGKIDSSTSGKNLGKKRNYAQFHLDFGQKDFLLHKCSTCGLMYAPRDATDEKNHSTYHKTYTDGIIKGVWRKERVVHVSSDDTGRVILVLDGDPTTQRNKVNQVVEMMEAELGDGWIFHKHCKAYLFISSSKRIAGCVIAESIKTAQKIILDSTDQERANTVCSKVAMPICTTLQFGNANFQREVLKKVPFVKHHNVSNEEYNGRILCEDEAVPAVCGIRAIWVSPSNRRKHIATHLLDAVRKSFEVDCVLDYSQLAFSQPTLAGMALASRYTGTKSFLVYKTCISQT